PRTGTLGGQSGGCAWSGPRAGLFDVDRPRSASDGRRAARLSATALRDCRRSRRRRPAPARERRTLPRHRRRLPVDARYRDGTEAADGRRREESADAPAPELAGAAGGAARSWRQTDPARAGKEKERDRRKSAAAARMDAALQRRRDRRDRRELGEARTAEDIIARLMRRRGFFPLFAAILLAGAAQLLVLPPFEGFDETAHYSYIREIADTRTIPIFGQSTIAKLVAEYH